MSDDEGGLEVEVEVQDLHPAIDYIRLWAAARQSWKFKKNRQVGALPHCPTTPTPSVLR
jgi:hypothetical protein